MFRSNLISLSWTVYLTLLGLTERSHLAIARAIRAMVLWIISPKKKVKCDTCFWSREKCSVALRTLAYTSKTFTSHCCFLISKPAHCLLFCTVRSDELIGSEINGFKSSFDYACNFVHEHDLKTRVARVKWLYTCTRVFKTHGLFCLRGVESRLAFWGGSRGCFANHQSNVNVTRKQNVHLIK